MKKTMILFQILFLTVFHGTFSYSQEKTLDFFLKQGLEHSPVLIDLSNQISSNRVDSLLIKAGQKPQVNFSAGLYYAPVIKGTGYAEPLTNISSITSVAGVSQKIFNRKTLEVQYSKLGIQNQALRISSEITELDLKKAITLQYLTACSVSGELSFNREILASSNEEEVILKGLAEKGLYRQVDYYRFLAELKTQELELKDLEIRYRSELSALNTLCGLADTASIEVVLPEMSTGSFSNNAGSPFFTRFITDSLKIRNDKLIINRNYKPTVSWFSDAGLVNNLPRELHRNFGFSIGAGLVVPIYDGHQKKLNYDRLTIAENTRAGYAGYFKQQFNQQLLNLYDELKKTREMIPLLNQQLEFENLVTEQCKALLRTGNISVTEYVIALKNLMAARHKFNQYNIRILQIITEINYWNQ